ncbi:quinol oxidase subunit 2 [Pullulanibacillus camelliae]|uniref:Quinol oxidase subunit 2 n=1 Tax=Pullulanibacillus camelliae TaxID=1707096 RepID=A0A8J2YAG4_9BACL|nr:cytochrome aa3 quinol oxidase subunit II [Pullulanibacillus camelliae]GGE29238.1 quinol oxidase subunit 2 [Pullulanibacillus camelliae]
MKRIKTSFKLVALSVVFLLLLTGCDVPVLQPQGPVGEQQYHLILWSLVLMFIVIAAVFILFGVIVFKYRASRKRTDNYEPEQEGNKKLEFIWTIIPIIIVLLLAIPMTITTVNLEKNPSPEKKPYVVYVTSAQWKWIFGYPEDGVESVNVLHIPSDRPVKFLMTSEGAMNSFWIPALGGQKYTMNNMSSTLYLEADHPGKYLGKAANFNGKYFAHMNFNVISQKQSDFDQWVKQVKTHSPALTMSEYNKLIKPSVVDVKTYSSYPKQLDTKLENMMSMEHMTMKNSGDMDSDMSGMKGDESHE